MFVHLDSSGRLALLSTLTGGVVCLFEPPDLKTHAQHIGAFTGDAGKYVASAHDSAVFLWALESGAAVLHARVKSHTSPLRQVWARWQVHCSRLYCKCV